MKSFFFLLFLSAHLTACGQGAGIGFWQQSASGPGPDPVPADSCIKYSVTRAPGISDASVFYTDCNRVPQSLFMASGTTSEICSSTEPNGAGDPNNWTIVPVEYCDGRPLPGPLVYEMTKSAGEGVWTEANACRARIRIFSCNSLGSNEVLIHDYIAPCSWFSLYTYVDGDSESGNEYFKIELSRVALTCCWNLELRSYDCTSVLHTFVPNHNTDYVLTAVIPKQNICLYLRSQ
jgi:hypothetical protein